MLRERIHDDSIECYWNECGKQTNVRNLVYTDRRSRTYKTSEMDGRMKRNTEMETPKIYTNLISDYIYKQFYFCSNSLF